MSIAIGSAPWRLRAHARFGGPRILIGERAPHLLQRLGAKSFNGKGCEAFDRGERTINDG